MSHAYWSEFNPTEVIHVEGWLDSLEAHFSQLRKLALITHEDGRHNADVPSMLDGAKALHAISIVEQFVEEAAGRAS